MSLTPEPTPAEIFDNDQFLPPVSRWTTLGGILMVATFGGAIALASVTKYSATVKADAIVRPAGEVRVVQAATEGTVESIAVSENQTVKEGDAIAVVDASRLDAQKKQLQEIINQSQTSAQQINQQLGDLENQILASAQFKSIPSESSAQQELIESALVKFATSQPDVAERLGRSRRVLLVKRSSIQQQLIQAKKEVNQIELKLENSVIRAPADGTILRLEVRNTGQTVQAGQRDRPNRPQRRTLGSQSQGDIPRHRSHPNRPTRTDQDFGFAFPRLRHIKRNRQRNRPRCDRHSKSH